MLRDIRGDQLSSDGNLNRFRAGVGFLTGLRNFDADVFGDGLAVRNVIVVADGFGNVVTDVVRDVVAFVLGDFVTFLYGNFPADLFGDVAAVLARDRMAFLLGSALLRVTDGAANFVRGAFLVRGGSANLVIFRVAFVVFNRRALLVGYGAALLPGDGRAFLASGVLADVFDSVRSADLVRLDVALGFGPIGDRAVARIGDFFALVDCLIDIVLQIQRIIRLAAVVLDGLTGRIGVCETRRREEKRNTNDLSQRSETFHRRGIEQCSYQCGGIVENSGFMGMKPSFFSLKRL